MKIYDCFTFYNESELLEIRLKELYNTVDHFVIVESNQSFTNKPKTWNFDRNRFKDYLDKIIYIQVTDMPGGNDPWKNETHQRNAIIRGLTNAEVDDIIIISDVDEILRAEAVESMRNSGQTLWALRMPLFNFKFNYMRCNPGQYDIWAMAARKSVFEYITPDTLRGMRFQFMATTFKYTNDGFQVVEHAGWHFSYMGDVKDKIQNFSHQEANTPEKLEQFDVSTSIRERKEWDRTQQNEYKIVEFTDYFPKSVVDSPEYQHQVLPEPEANVFDIIPAYCYTK
jgi:Glycosyltransferase family 17